jgi:hypothetical protein
MHVIAALWIAAELFRPFILRRDPTRFCLQDHEDIDENSRGLRDFL